MSTSEPTQSFAAPPAGGEVDLRALLRIVSRRRWIGLGVLATVLVVGAVVTIRAPRIYRARATVLIEQNAPEVLSGVREVYDLGNSGYWNSREYYQTQYRVISSVPVAQKVAATLGLNTQALAEALEAAGPEPLQALAAGDRLQGLEADLRAKIEFLGFSGKESRADIVEALRALDAIELIRGRIDVEPVKDSRLVNIAVEDDDAERAAIIANAVAAAYIEVNLDQKIDLTRTAVDWLTDQMLDLKKKLESSEQALDDFKLANNIVSVSMEDRQTIISQRLSELNQSLTEVQAQRLVLESQTAVLKKAEETGISTEGLDKVISNQLVQKLKETYAELKLEEVEFRLRYTDEHPKLAAVREKVEMVQRELAAEVSKILRAVDNEYQAKLDTERRLRAALETVKAEALEVNRRETEYSRLKRELDNNQSLYEMVLKRQKEADLTQMLKVNNVRTLEAAQAPLLPVRPKVRMNMLIALVLGLVGGLGAILVVDYLDNTVKTQEQVEQVLGLSFLGIIPMMAGEAKAERPQSDEPEHYILAHPRSSVAECCRAIRTNILFMSPDKPARTILVTSAGPREGKSTTSTNLAITMAVNGARVLLVDTDMRRPRLHKAFGVPSGDGISSVIVGEAKLSDAIRTTGVPGLDILPCGPIPPNPAELLHTAAFRALLAEITAKYDRVILDSPPVAAVTDALVLASMTDGVVMVVNAKKTPWQMVVRARRRIEDVGGRLYGAILNSVDIGDPRSGGYYEYQYYRAAYGDDDKQPAGAKS